MIEINTMPRISKAWEEDLGKGRYEGLGTKYEILETRYKIQEARD